jgi:hypothetical protein
MLFPLLSQLVAACIAPPDMTNINKNKRANFMIEQNPLHLIMAASPGKFRLILAGDAAAD